jgi:ribonuclease D
MIAGPDVAIAAIFCGSTVAVVATIARAFAQRRSDAPRIPSDVTQRLERMEHAIDSIAVEVERISEGQRFTTKLLADKVGDARMER